MKWISVTDRLPEKTVGFNCIVSITNDCVDGLVMPAIFSFDSFYSELEIRRLGDGKPYVGVTHWMPLPEPPEC